VETEAASVVLGIRALTELRFHLIGPVEPHRLKNIAFECFGEKKKPVRLRVLWRRDPGGLDVENPHRDDFRKCR
jgi:hypothetical protein